MVRIDVRFEKLVLGESLLASGALVGKVDSIVVIDQGFGVRTDKVTIGLATFALAMVTVWEMSIHVHLNRLFLVPIAFGERHVADDTCPLSALRGRC
jgi:hypothetical protein